MQQHGSLANSDAFVQVGSGVGNSAVHWGKLVKEQNGVVLAIDTWVGDLQTWFSEGWREAMAWQDGQSKVYERFMNHMVQHDLTDTVIPLRAGSITAARMLYFLNYTVDAIYLDNAQVSIPLPFLSSSMPPKTDSKVPTHLSRRDFHV